MEFIQRDNLNFRFLSLGGGGINGPCHMSYSKIKQRASGKLESNVKLVLKIHISFFLPTSIFESLKSAAASAQIGHKYGKNMEMSACFTSLFKVLFIPRNSSTDRKKLILTQINTNLLTAKLQTSKAHIYNSGYLPLTQSHNSDLSGIFI